MPLDPHERELWVSLREHLDELWREREKRLDERWHAQEAALRKATSELEERLKLLNELRENVLTRDEYDAKHEALTADTARTRETIERIGAQSMTIAGHKTFEERLAKLENWRSNVMGRAIAVAFAGAVVVAAVAAILTHLATK